MEVPQPLGSPRAVLSTERCPRCGELPGPIPDVPAVTPGPVRLRRCGWCGTRLAATADETRFLLTCNPCGLPFLSDELLPHASHRCRDCGAGRAPAELPDRALTDAMEREVTAALADRWSFVLDDTLADYLERVAHQLAERMEDGPRDVQVVLVDEHHDRTLALPSGLLLISLGTLEGLEDEAELAFVLGHELAHAASRHAAVQLVRLGYLAATREPQQEAATAWTEVVLDLVRIGYGRHRERDADARSLEAMIALDYDPRAAVRYLARLKTRIENGEPELAELAAAHPTPQDRIRRLEKALFGRIDGMEQGRVNREVFRRAVGRRRASRPPTAREPGHSSSSLPLGPERSVGRRNSGWVAAAVAVLAAIIITIGLLLAP